MLSLFVKPAILQENSSNSLIWAIIRVCICLTWGSFLKWSLSAISPSTLKKCANNKAFYIVHAATLYSECPIFRNINLRTSGSFWMLLLVAVTKFHDKFASLRQVNSPSAKILKFQVCCINMYFVWFLVNFALFYVFFFYFSGFRGFTWNLWLCDCTKYQKSCLY